jgi:hypothetical protein
MDRLAEIEQHLDSYTRTHDEYELESLVRDGTLQWLIAELKRLRTAQIWTADTWLPRNEVTEWALEQSRLGRKVVALIPPDHANDGPRYAGYYCVDGPEPPTSL